MMNLTNKKSSITVNCPTCAARVEWNPQQPSSQQPSSQQQWRPFCSERCKLIDLGEWASESYSIKGETENEFQTKLNDN